MSSELYQRQMQLAEVGESGQLRIGQARFAIAADPSGAFELEYLRRAGAEAQITNEAPTESFAHAAKFRFGPSRTIAEGAWRALAKLRGVVL